jgi:hypothetical protein
MGVQEGTEHEHVSDPDVEAPLLTGCCDHGLAKRRERLRTGGFHATAWRPEGGPGLGPTESEFSRFNAAAPGARPHGGRHKTRRAQALAERAGLRPTLVTEVALGAAVTQAKTGGIEVAGGQCMPNDKHHAALPEQRKRLIRCLRAHCRGEDPAQRTENN